MSTFKTFETAWCPGCGNFGILNSIKIALEELDKDPYEVLMVAGIGQAAKTPQYLSANNFCGLHGRALPAAAAAKIANNELTVIVDSGDGDSYGEGGNHFIHNIRRNVNITHLVHDNQIYGLTKGQASPTTSEGQITEVQTSGSINTPLNPIMMALAAGAGFVARAFSGDPEQLVKIIKEAIEYPGYAYVDILQPCVTFNKINTYAYYKSKVYHLPEDYDFTNRAKAFELELNLSEKIPTGIIYKENKPNYHDKQMILKTGEPLINKKNDKKVLEKLIHEFV
ncbi:MAG: 2-oxoacid:ferredoxin oxidoreductase subunit beta [Anaerocolumna sp.]